MMTKRIKLFLVSAMVCLMAVSAVFLTLNVRTTKANEQPLTGSKAQAEVTAEVELSTFAVTDSASIRTESPKGIRFLTSISKEEVAKLPNNAVFGTLMIPTELLGGAELTVDTQKAANAQVKVYGENGDNYEYLTALVGNKNNDGDFEDFSSDFYTKEITARSYVTYTYGEGTTFTDYSNAVSWSVAQTAGNLLAKKYGELQAEQITYLKGVVDATKVDAYNEENTPVILTQNIVDGAFDVDLPFDAEGVIGVYGDNYSAYSVVDSDTIKITLENSAVTGKVSFTVITERKTYALTVDINVLESMKATLTGNYVAQFDSELYEDLVTVPTSDYYVENDKLDVEYLPTFQGENGVLKVSCKVNISNGQSILKIKLPKEFTDVITVKFWVVGKAFGEEANTAPGLLGFCDADYDYTAGAHWYSTTELAPDTWHVKSATPDAEKDAFYFVAGWSKGFELEIYFAFAYAGDTLSYAKEELTSSLKENELANYDSELYEAMAVNSAPAGYTVEYLETHAGETGVMKYTFRTGNGGINLNLLKKHSGTYTVRYMIDTTATQGGCNKYATASSNWQWADGTAHLYARNVWLTKVVTDSESTLDVIRFGFWNSGNATTDITLYVANIWNGDQTETAYADAKATAAATLDEGELADFDSDVYLSLLSTNIAYKPVKSFTAEILESVTLGGETRENVLKLTINLNASANWSFVTLMLPKTSDAKIKIKYFVASEDMPANGQLGLTNSDAATLVNNGFEVKDVWTEKEISTTGIKNLGIGMVNHTLGATLIIYVDAIVLA